MENGEGRGKRKEKRKDFFLMRKEHTITSKLVSHAHWFGLAGCIVSEPHAPAHQQGLG